MEIRLREWRLKRGYSLYTLADRAGVHFTTIVRIERGRLSPTVALLEKLANALEIGVRDFFPTTRPKGRAKKGDRR